MFALELIHWVQAEPLVKLTDLVELVIACLRPMALVKVMPG
ncbi:hypothetical protein [Laspinema olomoucense]|nr:hypothetical protein [Laspinema sp. D3c]